VGVHFSVCVIHRKRYESHGATKETTRRPLVELALSQFQNGTSKEEDYEKPDRERKSQFLSGKTAGKKGVSLKGLRKKRGVNAVWTVPWANLKGGIFVCERVSVV